MAGVSFVAKEFFEDIVVVGSQAQGASSMVKSLQKGAVTTSEFSDTFADGIKVKKVRPEMFELLDQYIDEAISVHDDKIATGVLDLIEQARVIAEGAGAINLAAFKELYEKNPRRFKNKNIVIIICGGNIDINLVDRIIDRGLVTSKRRVRFKLLLKDKPGALKTLTRKISNTTANVLEVVHDRNSRDIGLSESIVEIVLETRGEEHANNILEYLQEDYEVIP